MTDEAAKNLLVACKRALEFLYEYRYVEEEARALAILLKAVIDEAEEQEAA